MPKPSEIKLYGVSARAELSLVFNSAWYVDATVDDDSGVPVFYISYKS